VSSLTDRLDGVEIKDAPIELTFPKTWKDQFSQLEKLHSLLQRRTRICVPLHLLPEFIDIMPKEWGQRPGVKDASAVLKRDAAGFFDFPTTMLDGAEIEHMLGLEMGQVTRLFLSFRRRASYVWHYEKCITNIKRYKGTCSLLEPYSDKVTMPLLRAPKFDKTREAPFITEAVKIVEDWKNTRFNYQTKSVLRLPTRVVILGEPEPRPMTILGDIDGETVYETEFKELYDAAGLIRRIAEVLNKYDIFAHYQAANASLAEIDGRFGE
jgi:hypothetical protein